MAVLTETQIKEGYFRDIGGFPSSKIVQEVNEYKGEDHLCIACTQLNPGFGYPRYSEQEKKRVLAEWIDFLHTNTKAFIALHFNSRVPQSLFDAACCQEDLEELRFKWGAYTDLSALESLKKLKFLYIGSGTGVRDISALGNMENIIVLYIENFRWIDDFSPLSLLDKLEQLVISGPTLGTTSVTDLEFLRKMESLVSVWLPNTSVKRKYTSQELESLRVSLPNLYDIYGCIWGCEES